MWLCNVKGNEPVEEGIVLLLLLLIMMMMMTRVGVLFAVADCVSRLRTSNADYPRTFQHGLLLAVVPGLAVHLGAVCSGMSEISALGTHQVPRMSAISTVSRVVTKQTAAVTNQVRACQRIVINSCAEMAWHRERFIRALVGLMADLAAVVALAGYIFLKVTTFTTRGNSPFKFRSDHNIRSHRPTSTLTAIQSRERLIRSLSGLQLHLD